MKVLTAQPTAFRDGDALDPADLNQTFLEATTALGDVEEKRLQRSVLTLPFVQDLSNPYTDVVTNVLMTDEQRTYRLRFPQTCYIERAELSANMTSSSEVQVTIATAGGATPAGATVPWLTTLGAVVTLPFAADPTKRLVPVTTYVSGTGAVLNSSVDVSDYNPERVLLVANTEYLVTVKAAASVTFTLNRFDVLLTLVTDRFMPGSSDLAAPPSVSVLFTDAVKANATLVQGNVLALSSLVSVLSTVQAPAPAFFVRHKLVAGTNPIARTMRLPRFDSSRAQCRAIALYVWGVADAAVTGTLTGTLRDAGGGVLETTTATFAAATQASGFGSSFSRTLVAATPGITAASASDYSVQLANSSATPMKAYALLMLSR